MAKTNPATYTSPEGGQLWKSGAVAPSIVGGHTYTPAASYASSSNPKKRYTVCEVDDGTVSCDCMGWTLRNPPGGRTCKHTEDYLRYLRPIRQGTSTDDLAAAVAPAAVPTSPNASHGGSLSSLMQKLEKGGL